MRWLSVYISALLVALVSGVPLLTLGLVLHESISRSLWLVVSTLLAAIAASWTSNVGSERGRARLLPVAGLSAAITAGLLIPILLLVPRLLPFLQYRQVYLLLLFSPLIACIATLSATRLRAPRRELRREVLTTLGLLVTAVVTVIGTLLVADLLGFAGA